MRVVISAPLCVSALLLALAGPATAGPAEVLKCTEIGDAMARLACFDRAAPSLRDLPRPPAPPAPPVAAAPPVPPEQRFGAERLEKEARAVIEQQEPDAITSVLKEAREVQPDRWLFLLENGQVWRQVVARSLPRIKPGSAVTVEKAVMGSYSMKIEGVPGLIKVGRTK